MESRYGKAHEFERIATALERMSCSEAFESVWCDSKATSEYSLTLRLGYTSEVARLLGKRFCRAIRDVAGGFNGVHVLCGDETISFDSDWRERRKAGEQSDD